MRVTIYYPNSDAMPIVEALRAGFLTRGDEVHRYETSDFKEVSSWTHMAVVIGLSRANAKINKAHLRAGKHVLLVDQGYIAPKHTWRFALDGFQSRFLHKKDTQKSMTKVENLLKMSGQQIHPAPNFQGRSKGVYLGMDQEYSDWHRLGVNHEYDSANIREIIAATPKLCGLRWLPGFPEETQVYMPRRTDLLKSTEDVFKTIQSARVVISHGHRGLVQALLAGVPVGVLSAKEINPVWDIAEKSFSRMFLTPHMNEELRMRTLMNIAHNEFTIEEIASGWAMKLIEPYSIKGIDTGKPGYLIEEYKLMHDVGKYRGGLDEDVVGYIKAMVEVHNATTLLDYGSGKGRQYLEFCQHLEWSKDKPIMPTCYDPAYAKYAGKPEGLFDGVICTDVAEHIPEAEVPAFLSDMLDYGRKFAVISIDTKPATKMLPDGRNCHLTLKPPEWWLGAITSALGNLTATTKITHDAYHIVDEATSMELIVVFRGVEQPNE